MYKFGCQTNMAGKLQNAFKLSSSRPILDIANKNEENVDIEPEALNQLVYVTNCTKCQMVLKKKPAKVILERCHDLVLTIEAGIMSGTLEVIKCENITIVVTEQMKVSTVTADSTTSLQLVLHKDESQLESLYSHQASKLSIRIKTGEESREFAVSPPPEDPAYLQFMSHWVANEGGGMKLVTEKVLRVGILPYTEGTK